MIVCILTFVGIVLLVFDLIFPKLLLTIITMIVLVLAVFGWFFLLYSYLSKKRQHIFFQKIELLDRHNSKYKNLFIIYDYIHQQEENLQIVKKAMEEVFFFSSKVYEHPEKAKKSELCDPMINYYLSLTKDKVKSNFFWDWNTNYFTWRLILVLLTIGIAGITILVLCYHSFPHPDDVIYTSLYFLFGAMVVPFLAKFFGHII